MDLTLPKKPRNPQREIIPRSMVDLASHATLTSLTAELETLVTRLDRGLDLLLQYREQKDSRYDRTLLFWQQVNSQYIKALGELDTVLAYINNGDRLFCPDCRANQGEPELSKTALASYARPCVYHVKKVVGNHQNAV